MRTWKNKKGLDNTIKRLLPTENSYNFSDKQHFKVFRLSFSETIPIFFIRQINADHTFFSHLLNVKH